MTTAREAIARVSEAFEATNMRWMRFIDVPPRGRGLIFWHGSMLANRTTSNFDTRANPANLKPTGPVGTGCRARELRLAR
jgi:hypothetical protein